jgi:hypothetical protein
MFIHAPVFVYVLLWGALPGACTQAAARATLVKIYVRRET